MTRNEMLRLLAVAYARRVLGVKKGVPVTVFGYVGKDYGNAPDSVLRRDIQKARKGGWL